MSGINLSPNATRPGLTREIVRLHQQGYSEDFIKTGNLQYTCVTNGLRYDADEVEIIVITQSYDPVTKRCNYLHLVQTFSGIRGLMLMDAVNFHIKPIPTAQLVGEECLQ